MVVSINDRKSPVMSLEKGELYDFNFVIVRTQQISAGVARPVSLSPGRKSAAELEGMVVSLFGHNFEFQCLHLSFAGWLRS